VFASADGNMASDIIVASGRRRKACAPGEGVTFTGAISGTILLPVRRGADLLCCSGGSSWPNRTPALKPNYLAPVMMVVVMVVVMMVSPMVMVMMVMSPMVMMMVVVMILRELHFSRWLLLLRPRGIIGLECLHRIENRV